jgi:hypothetical protein
MTEWLKNRFCLKCHGDGWIWHHQLSKYYGEENKEVGLNRYECDDACHFDERNVDALRS